VAVGLAEDWAFAGRREATVHALILLGLSALVACLAAWLGGRWFISRPIASLLTAAGRWRGGDLSARVGLAEGGSELGQLGAAFDSMAAELDDNLTALTASEARYRALIEAIAAMVWTTRPDGTVEDMPDWRALTGQTQEQVRGLGWLEALHPDDRDRTRELWLQATAAGAAYDTEYRVRGRDGSYRWYNARGVPVRGPDGVPREHVGVCIDIDDRKRAEAELRLSQERLMLAEEVGRIGNWDWDLDTGRTTWSTSLFRLLGLDPEADEPSGEAFYARIHPDDRGKVTTEAEAAILGGRPLSSEFRILRPDGTVRWLATRGEALRDETGRPRRFVGVNFDVTEQHEAAERQRLLLRELSHRVKNCLATVQSIASLSLAGDRSLDEARETFTRRLRALAGTHNLLTASEWRGADLWALARGELKPFGPRATIAGESLILGAKAAQMLGLVLHELVTNAAKHGALSVSEGRVELRWEVAAASPELFRFVWRERQGPPVRQPVRDGFGRKLVEQAVPYELKAKVRLDFAVEGLTYELEAPLNDVLAPG
jgi:PAS domain S-box-containing protein